MKNVSSSHGWLRAIACGVGVLMMTLVSTTPCSAFGIEDIQAVVRGNVEKVNHGTVLQVRQSVLYGGMPMFPNGAVDESTTSVEYCGTRTYREKNYQPTEAGAESVVAETIHEGKKVTVIGYGDRTVSLYDEYPYDMIVDFYHGCQRAKDFCLTDLLLSTDAKLVEVGDAESGKPHVVECAVAGGGMYRFELDPGRACLTQRVERWNAQTGTVTSTRDYTWQELPDGTFYVSSIIKQMGNDLSNPDEALLGEEVIEIQSVDLVQDCPANITTVAIPEGFAVYDASTNTFSPAP